MIYFKKLEKLENTTKKYKLVPTSPTSSSPNFCVFHYNFDINKSHCKCTVKKLSERFSDDDLDAVFNQKPEEIIKDTKFASEFCEKEIL